MLMANPLKIAVAFMLLLACCSLIAEAGGKGKGGEEDIIMYNGNIVLRGDKKGGSIIMANSHTNEEVEFSPSFFGGHGGYGGGHGGYGGGHGGYGGDMGYGHRRRR